MKKLDRKLILALVAVLAVIALLAGVYNATRPKATPPGGTTAQGGNVTEAPKASTPPQETQAPGSGDAQGTQAPGSGAPQGTQDPGEETDPVPAGKTFTVEVTHKDGTVNTFTYTSEEPFVGPVLVEAGLISGTTGQFGLMVEEVDGERAVYSEDSAYWAVYVNGDYGMVGIDQTPVTEGDVIGLVYTVD